MNTNWPIWIWPWGVLLVLAVLLGLGGWWLYRYIRQPLPPSPEAPHLPLPLEPLHLVFEALAALNPSSRRLNDQPEAWRYAIRAYGAELSQQGVRRIYLLHGTFVGSDPANVLPTIKGFFPKLTREFDDRFGRTMKGWVDKLTGDNGNFLPSYVELLQEGLGHGIQCELFSWSSSNHHAARLEGAMNLIERVASEKPPLHKGERTLLIGHSHARQVFALFTQLVQGAQPSDSLGSQIWTKILDRHLATETLRVKARKLHMRPFDFVTLGGPVRYPWAYLPGMKVLHIVHHQGEDEAVTSALAFWRPTGDYVQQWGMIGSDTLAPTQKERLINRELDELLGKGWHTKLWWSSIQKRRRLGDFGRTLLVDYKDLSRANFMKSGFGHGIYTRTEAMLFHMDVIIRHLYSGK